MPTNRGGTLVVKNSNIVNNAAFDPFWGGSGHQLSQGGFGGGIYNVGTVTVENSTIAGNSSDMGGGIESDAGTTVTIPNSAITGNSAWQQGGGIYTLGKLTLINSTLAHNTAGSPYVNYIGGGAVSSGYHTTGPQPLLLALDTIYGNTSSGTSGAIENNGDILTIKDSIIAGNKTSQGSDITDQDQQNVSQLITGRL